MRTCSRKGTPTLAENLGHVREEMQTIKYLPAKEIDTMKTLISILRGINVGGHNKIPMAELKALYEELKFKDILTYIQSGNVVFKAAGGATDRALAIKIEKAIKEKFGFDVPVITRSAEEMGHALSVNPFLKKKNIDREKLHITFLNEVPQQARLDAIRKYDYPPDLFEIIGKEVFLYIPGGYGVTKLSNNFFENKLKVKATTRNWKTVNKLFDMANE